LRMADVRGGDDGRRSGGRRQRTGVQRRRRRRLRPRTQRGRARRQDLVGVDRRRRVTRAPGRKRAARRRSYPIVIAGNWKMFRGPDPQALREALGGLSHVVAPPFTRLRDCVEAGLTTYAQNVHWESEGAFTGEVSAY